MRTSRVTDERFLRGILGILIAGTLASGSICAGLAYQQGSASAAIEIASSE